MLAPPQCLAFYGQMERLLRKRDTQIEHRGVDKKGPSMTGIELRKSTHRQRGDIPRT